MSVMRAGRARLPWVIGLAMLSCSGPGAGDAGRDAGLDAPDARADASTDAADARDAPGGADDPGWVELPGFMPECEIRRATNPGALLRFTWEPCPVDLPGGCLMMVTEPSDLGELSIPPAAFGYDHHGGHFTITRLRSPGYFAVAIVHADGVVAGAWSSAAPLATASCIANPASGGGYVALKVNATSSGTASYEGQRIYHARLDEIGETTVPWWSRTPDAIPDGNSLQHNPTSAATVAGDVQLLGALLVVEGSDWAHLGGYNSPVPGYAVDISVLGHEVFWVWRQGEASEIHVSSLAAGERILYRQSTGEILRGLATDGTYVVWRTSPPVSSPGGTTDFDELWVADYTTDAASFSARSLRTDLGSSPRGIVADGLYAYRDWRSLEQPSHIVVVDLADGSRRRFEVPAQASSTTASWSLPDLLWVTRDEVAVAGGYHDLATDERVRTVLRIDLGTLAVEPPP